MAKTIPMGCLVDKVFHDQFQKMAERNNRTIASEMRRAMEFHLEKGKQKKIVTEKIISKRPK